MLEGYSKMSIEEAFKGLSIAGDDFNPTQIVKLLTELDKNIAMKTEIPKPSRLVLLKVLALYLKKKGLEDSGEILENIIEYLMIYNVSKKRKGREEAIEIAKGMARQKLTEKLLGKSETL